MRKWSLLACAIVSEVTGSLSLKAAMGQPAWYALVAVGYLGAFAALGAALRAGMALGVAYGVWGAMGVALTAGFAALLYGEPLTPVMLLGIACIIGGVVLVEFGSHARPRSGEGEA
ncbi:SMR family transporter [Actinokineospora sp. PR83]|uniref:DMT family transporter n=1 Tax=Actinokineospora sp. PR83 TaxID=2884908 RepID=UPI001F3AC46C|nr:SMR family transporter [Actinokineospora sp. PR83]MCG8916061.1 SMR family transporter [Actinokineospora sp. PR83]